MIFDIQRFSTHDGPGIRTVVFLKGCPLSCAWCENPESQAFGRELLYTRSRCVGCGDCLRADLRGALRPAPDGGVEVARGVEPGEELRAACPALALRVVGREAAVGEIIAEVLKDRAFFEKSGGGLTLSGGEPLAQIDFALSCLEAARAEGIDIAVESCLAVPLSSVERAAALRPRWLVDLKHTDPAAFRAGTGGDAAGPLRNLSYLAERGADLALRVPVVPGFNDDERSMESLLAFAASLPRPGPEPRRVDLLPYHDLAAGKYAGLGRTYAYALGLRVAADRLSSYADLGRSLGLDMTIGG
jgi:pyruvate formate lyase activating enzyme